MNWLDSKNFYNNTACVVYNTHYNIDQYISNNNVTSDEQPEINSKETHKKGNSL